MPAGKKLIALAVTLGALIVPQAASATITSVFDGDVACTVQGDGVRFCGSSSPRSTTDAWDGVPIDVNVAFPPEPASGPDGNFPLVMMFHGYGGDKLGLGSMQHWLDKGYATFSMTDRGFHESCGSTASRTAGGTACDDGYVRLIDNRYEVRDAQDFAGELADEGAGLINPQEIAAIGGSYGGGMSMALGALKDRVVNPDYSLSPWQSPDGKPMQIAAAAPNIPWTDLAYSLAPNGSTLDYVADAPYQGRPGVEKLSLVNGLYAGGLSAPGTYAPEGTDPTADLTGWKNLLAAGEPYGEDVDGIIDELTMHHSSYSIDHSESPAPMLMSSGFTDDLFPVDETIRYYNRTKTQYPDSDLALFFGDFGHPRAQNKADVTGALSNRIDDWFDWFVKGEGSSPQQGVEAFTQTCPKAAPSGGPYTADSWADMAPGEIRLNDDSTKTIAADSNSGGNFSILSGACAAIPDDPIDGAATYSFDAAPSGGFTMMGAVSVIAKFTLPGDTSQVAARLVDVAPDNTETLVDRGLWRPASGGPTKQVFQLHPNGWNFAAGHVPKLELMAADAAVPDPSGLLSYGRASNDQQDVTVSDLEARIPVLEKPGALDGLVKAPAEKFVPDGYDLAADFAALKSPKAKLASDKLKVKGKKATAEVTCPAAFDACNDGKVSLEAKGKGYKVGSVKFNRIAGGKTAKLQIKLSKKAKKTLKKKGKLKVETTISIGETSAVYRNSNGILYQKKK